MGLTLSAIGGALKSAGKAVFNGASKLVTSAGKWASENQDQLFSAGTNLLSNINFGGGSSAREAAQLQYENNLKLQKQAQNWNEYMYKNRYQMQVEDLEKAGINKLYGLGNAPSVTSGTTSTGMPDIVGEQNSKREQLLKLLDFGATYSAKRAEGKLLEQQANTEYYNTQLRALEVYTQELENLQKKKDLSWSDKKNKAEIEELISQTRKNLAEANITSLQSLPLERYEEIIKNYPELGKFLEQIGRAGISAKSLAGLFNIKK